jgi:hypothetical protein
MVRLSVTVIAEQKAAEVGSSGRWRPLWFQLLRRRAIGRTWTTR